MEFGIDKPLEDTVTIKYLYKTLEDINCSYDWRRSEIFQRRHPEEEDLCRRHSVEHMGSYQSRLGLELEKGETSHRPWRFWWPPNFPTSPSREGAIEGEERAVKGQKTELNFLLPCPLASCPYLNLAKELEKWWGCSAEQKQMHLPSDGQQLARICNNILISKNRGL